jgi:hypothetical protein
MFLFKLAAVAVAAATLLCSPTTVSAQFGPGALNNLIFYVVDKEGSTTFMCGSPSSRCVFQREEYGSDPEIRGGNVADQLEGAVWATVDTAVDKLILDDCSATVCITACFSDCTCTNDATGTNCTTTTPVPTEAPGSPAPTPIPKAPQCEQKTDDTSRCADLMENVPLGTECDCYNFCHNNFTSCCEVGAGCGTLDCDVEPGSTPGGVGSYVYGCTDFDRRVVEDPNGSGSGSDGNSTGGGGGSSSGNSSHGIQASRQVVPVVLAVLTLVVAGLFV